MTDSESILNAIRAEVLPKLATIEANQNNLVTKLDEHIKGATPLRDMVARHDQSIQRLKGAGWVLSFLWTSLLTYFGYHSGANK